MRPIDLESLPAALRDTAERGLAIANDMNRLCVARGALLDAAAADGLREVIARSNALLDAITGACEPGGPRSGDVGWLDAEVADAQRWFEAWKAREAS